MRTGFVFPGRVFTIDFVSNLGSRLPFDGGESENRSVRFCKWL